MQFSDDVKRELQTWFRRGYMAGRAVSAQDITCLREENDRLRNEVLCAASGFGLLANRHNSLTALRMEKDMRVALGQFLETKGPTA